MADTAPAREGLVTAVRQLLDTLLDAEYELTEDVAWIALSSAQFEAVPGDSQMCPVRAVPCKRYRGIEFRVSPWVSSRTDAAALRGHVAWNATKRTRKQLNMRG